MSKSDLRHELLQDQLITVDDERSTSQRSGEDISKMNCDRDFVTPFAKDIVDNVVTGALSVLDISRKEGKPWKDVLLANKSSSKLLSGEDVRFLDENNTDSTSDSFSTVASRRPVVQVMHLRVQDDIVCDSVHAEQVAKIVKGLQNIQIGDSAYVLPAGGSNIKEQVKKAVRNINSLEFGDMETARLIICDGQGDVDAAILEAEMGPPSNINCKPQNDASKISTCFLHKMIEELEDNDLTKGNLPDHGNKEGIASWEESEEKLIRIIEGPGDEKGPALLEYREYHHPVTFDQESIALDAEKDAASGNSENPLDQDQQVYSKEEMIDERENCNRPRNCADNYTDEEPYWCTAGLITRVVTPEHGGVFLSKATMAGKESRTSDLEGNLQAGMIETSIHESMSIMEHAEERSRSKDKELKLKSKEKTSFGKKLRKFFSRFKRSKDC